MSTSASGDLKADGIVRLNIGGKRFYTTASTLLSQSPDPERNFFSGLLSGQFRAPLDEKGFYFIDRNGRYFEPILDYLRTGNWVQPECLDRRALLEEARFYGIEPNVYTMVTDSSLEEKLNSTAISKFETALSMDGVKELASYICEQFWEAAQRGSAVKTPHILPSKETLKQLIITHGSSTHQGSDLNLGADDDVDCIYSDVYHSAIQNLGIQQLSDCLKVCFKISVEIDSLDGTIERSGLITISERSYRERRKSNIWMVAVYVLNWNFASKQPPEVTNIYSPPPRSESYTSHLDMFR